MLKEDSSQVRLCLFCIAAAVMLVSGELAARSADEDQSVVNYAYAVFFGTGVYKVEDQRAFVIRAPLFHEIREPSPEQTEIKLLLPALAGFYDYDFDSAFKGDTPGDAATLSFVPGLAFEYVMNERWRLKPFEQLGFGQLH